VLIKFYLECAPAADELQVRMMLLLVLLLVLLLLLLLLLVLTSLLQLVHESIKYLGPGGKQIVKYVVASAQLRGSLGESDAAAAAAVCGGAGDGGAAAPAAPAARTDVPVGARVDVAPQCSCAACFKQARLGRPKMHVGYVVILK